MMQLVLPWPPTVNTYWTPFIAGQHASLRLSKRGRKFRADAEALILAQLGGKPEPMDGRLSVTIELNPPTRSRRDIDNHVKGILDAMTHCGIWNDDEQVDMLGVYRKEVISGGRAVIFIEEIQPE